MADTAVTRAAGAAGATAGAAMVAADLAAGELGFEDFPCPDPGLHRAHGARCDWPLASHRPAWGSARTGRCYWRPMKVKGLCEDFWGVLSVAGRSQGPQSGSCEVGLGRSRSVWDPDGAICVAESPPGVVGAVVTG